MSKEEIVMLKNCNIDFGKIIMLMMRRLQVSVKSFSEHLIWKYQIY